MTGNGRAPAGAADEGKTGGRSASAPKADAPRAPAESWIATAIHKFEKPLTLYVGRIVHDVERARDVVQEAFLRLCLQHQDEVEPHLAEWLYTVCRNKALDVRRKERRMTELKDETAESWATTEPGPAEAMERTQEAARASELMGHLSENQQEVLRLKFQHGLSYKEISRVTSLSVTNVGFLIHTGLKSLRQRMVS